MSKKQDFLNNFIRSTPASEALAFKVNQALESIESLDFPNRKDEYWKYTSVNSILKGEYSQLPDNNISNVDDYYIDGCTDNVLVFINGYYSVQLSNISDSENIEVCSLENAKASNYPQLEKHLTKYINNNSQIFTAINTAYSSNGVFIHVAKNSIIESPIHIINITDGDNPGLNPRNLFLTEKSSEVKIINTFHSVKGGGFTNSVTEILAEENSKVEFFTLQNQSSDSKQVNSIAVLQKSNSIFSSGIFTFGGSLVRNNLNITVDGSGCETNINGLYITKDSQHVDNHTRVDHIQPNCESNELYKGILSDKSTGVFNGKVYVKDIAQQTNAFQSNQNILLSDDASVNSKPELEIYADDVKCSHGSTTGQFDEEAVFYLRSRGIGEESARKLLVNAFAADVLDIVSVPKFRDILENLIQKNLS